MKVLIVTVITVLLFGRVRSGNLYTYCLESGFGVGDEDVNLFCAPKHCYEENGEHFCTRCFVSGDRVWNGDTYSSNLYTRPDLRTCGGGSTYCTDNGYKLATWNGGKLCLSLIHI